MTPSSSSKARASGPVSQKTIKSDANGTLSTFEDAHESPKMLSPTLSTFGNFASAKIEAPESYAERLTELQARCPDGVPEDRWRLFLKDASRILCSMGSSGTDS